MSEYPPVPLAASRSRSGEATPWRGRATLAAIACGLLLLGIPAGLGSTTAGTASPLGPAPVSVGHGAALLAAAQRSLDERGTVSAPPSESCTAVHQAEYPEVSPHQRLLKQGCEYAAARASASAPGWVDQSGRPPSFYLYDFVLTYDSADRYVVLFGGPVLPSAAAPPETWTYRAGAWTQLPASTSPAACLSSAISDDPSDGYLVYLSGTTLANGSNCPTAGETWSFHAGRWSQLVEPTSPSPRSGASLTNDSSDGYLLLFGGISAKCGNGVCNDTWSFSAGTWTQLYPSSAPSNRSGAGLTYDSADGYVLLFGGEGAGADLYTMYNDTWSFKGGLWTQLHPKASPPEPFTDALAFDDAGDFAFYTQACGNVTALSDLSEMTWEFVNGNWSRLPGSCTWSGSSGASGPEQRVGEGTAYDAADGYFLLFGGGIPYDGQDLSDSWSFAGSNWTNRTAPGLGFLPTYERASVTYDAADGLVLLFGGLNGSVALNQTWAYNGVNWTQLSTSRSPPARWDAGMVYDDADGYVVLFGGYPATGSVAFNDTWEFLGGQWSELHPASAPSPRSGAGMVDDVADRYVLLFGGNEYPDTWSFHAGAWTNLTSQSVAHPASGYIANPIAYDASDGYVLLFGTVYSGYPYYSNETWIYEAGVWSNLTGAAGRAPPPRDSAALAGMGPNGGVLLFAGYCVLCSRLTDLADTWVFLEGVWQPSTLPVSPQPRELEYLVFDPKLPAGVMFGGVNYTYPSVQPDQDLWFWEPSGGPSPSVASFSTSPEAVDEGVPTVFSAVVEGGTAPLTYAYTGLPVGCTSVDLPTLNCTPAGGSAGSYMVTVTVADANGNLSNATARLDVNPRPTIASFTAAPTGVAIGNRTTLDANVTGGTAPITFAYSGLPPGCLSQDVPALPCTPGVAGSYLVAVVVVDAFDVTARSGLGFNATPLVVGALTLDGFQADPPTVVVGNGTLLEANASVGSGPATFSFSGLPAGCASANVSRLSCLPTSSGSYDPTVHMGDPVGDTIQLSVTLSVLRRQSVTPLTLRSAGVTPSNVSLGGSVVYFASGDGGVSPLSYSYVDLPPGCLSEDLPVLVCTPNATGNYTSTISVTDATGQSADASVRLVVGTFGSQRPPALEPLEAYLAVAPSSIVLGEEILLTATTSGGALPVSYRYLGLPIGCSANNSSSLDCTPKEVGNYTVELVVTDAAGVCASARASLTVAAASGSLRPGPASSPLLPLPLSVAALLVGALLVVVVLGLFRARPPPRTPSAR